MQRCKRIVNGLLDFARPKPATRQPIDLNTVVQHGLFLLQHHPQYKRVKVVTELETVSPIMVHGDADPTVNVSGSRTMVAALKKLGADVTYLEVVGGNHTDVVVPNLPLAFEFLAGQKKKATAPGTTKQ